MFVVLRPSSQSGMQMGHHRFRLHRPGCFEPGSDLLQEAENLLLLREGATSPPNTLDMEPEAIHPLFDRHHGGLFLTERETSATEPCFKNRLDRLTIFPR